MPRSRPSLDDILDPIARNLAGSTAKTGPGLQTQLAQLAALSKNAQTSWFGLIGLCLFVAVTLLGHKDTDFFAYGTATTLPLVEIDIPVRSFFIIASLLVAALYIYLHLYLISLWAALAGAATRIGDHPLADRVFPWPISYAALWKGTGLRGDAAAPRVPSRLVIAVSFAPGWLFGLAVLSFLWYRSLPAHEEWLTLWIAFCLWAATVMGLASFIGVRALMAGTPGKKVVAMHRRRRRLTNVFAVLLAFLSWETTEGGILGYAGSGDQVIPLYPADLREAELTRKPPDWRPWHLWREEYQERFRRRNGIDAGVELTREQRLAFEGEAKRRYAEYIAQLDAPDLQEADLRKAIMHSAFLPAAILRGADMQGADLRGAEMQGADLRGARMEGAALFGAKLQGAALSRAKLHRADFRGAEMQGTVLSRAAMHGAVLSPAQLQGADFRWAEMHGAVLSRAQMHGAVLSQAKMRGAALSQANMQGAVLRGADMRGADLRGADMQGTDLSRTAMQEADLRAAEMLGADLRGAQMQGADCDSASFGAALLHSAILTCKENTLNQAQLALAVGDYRTVLPEGLTVTSCLEESQLTEDMMDALSHHPAVRDDPFRRSRAEIRHSLLCNRGADGNLIEQPRRVGRSVAAEQ
jgi:uncharacterized protein YjbI with pentapeptide repeats